MKQANYIVFDCETGGLDHNKNPITQIALLTLDGSTLKEINRFETFIAPYDNLKIEKVTLEITGFTMKEIESGVSKKEAVNLLSDYIKSSTTNYHPSNKPIMVGHNVQFDMGFIGSLFEREGKDIYEIVSRTQVDTMVLAKMYSPKKSNKSIRLGNVCEWFDIELKNAHSAMPDVIATAELFKTFTNTLRMGDNPNVKQQEEVRETARMRFQF